MIDEDEAMAHVAHAGLAWLKHARATEWLAAGLSRQVTSARVTPISRPPRR